MFSVFEHTADIGLRLESPTFEELLIEAGRGLLSLLVDNPEDLRPEITRTLDIAGNENDLLLFDWLNELLYLADVDDLLFSEFEVGLTEKGITATVRGEVLDPARHRLSHEVKAVTYHGLKVEQSPAGWQGEVILDI